MRPLGELHTHTALDGSKTHFRRRWWTPQYAIALLRAGDVDRAKVQYDKVDLSSLDEQGEVIAKQVEKGLREEDRDF